MSLVSVILNSLIDFIYPPKCAFCDDYLQDVHVLSLCVACENSLQKLDAEFTAPRLQKIWFDKAVSVFAYQGGLRHALHGFKYSKRFDLAKIFEPYLEGKIEKNEAFDMIVPVPLSAARLSKRGFNQAAILAKMISQKIGVRCSLDLLRRTKDVGPQVGRDLQLRLTAVKGIFDVRDKLEIKDKKILLVDDVITTGATVNECAKVLKKAGASKVYVVSIARTI